MTKTINQLNELNESPADDDELLVRDTSAMEDKRVSYSNVMGGLQDEINQRTIYVGSVAELADISSSGGESAYLNEGYKSGPFTSTSDDISSEVDADPQQGVYVPFSSDLTGASGGWIRDNAEYELNLYWFGASGDYDAGTETPGKIAVNANDNFDAFNGARQLLEYRNQGRLVVEGAPGNSDFWCRNMARFQLSNFELFIARGTTVRTTTPSSFGGIIIVGEAGVTENSKVLGGGTVRGYLPELGGLDLWQAETSYPAETYIKTSAGHAYWTENGGTTGTTEPTVIAGSETDGTVVWRDALNENGITISGDNVRVIGMNVPEVSHKGISIQSPPWRDARFIDNRVGRTHHDGIEMKGNQGITGQEELFAVGGICRGNVVESAGRHGIHVEQPSTGNNKNEDMWVIDNRVVAAGVRQSDGDGIRVNRCIRPIVRGNKVLSAGRNGVFIRLCDQVSGDISTKDYGLWGVAFQECAGFSLDSLVVDGAGGGSDEAVRWQDNTGPLWIGDYKVYGSGYSYAHRVISGDTPKVGSADLTPGVSGTVSGSPPLVSAGAISSSFTGFTHESGSASVPSSDREVFVNETGRINVISGAIYGGVGIRLEIIPDGGSTIVLDGSTAPADGGGDMIVIQIPPIVAFESLVLRANNNTGSAKTIAWNVVYS